MQEALADSFEVMGLWEDALVQYDELEASFFQALKGQLTSASVTHHFAYALTDSRTQHVLVWSLRRDV